MAQGRGKQDSSPLPGSFSPLLPPPILLLLLLLLLGSLILFFLLIFSSFKLFLLGTDIYVGISKKIGWPRTGSKKFLFSWVLVCPHLTLVPFLFLGMPGQRLARSGRKGNRRGINCNGCRRPFFCGLDGQFWGEAYKTSGRLFGSCHSSSHSALRRIWRAVPLNWGYVLS